MKIDNRKLDLILARHCKVITSLRSVVSAQTLTRIRKGEEIKPSTLGLIAKELGCDPEDIIEKED